MLNVSETTIRRWVVESKIPAYRIHGQHRFSRIEIESWVMHNKMHTISEEPLFTSAESDHSTTQGGSKQFSLYRALNKGEVLHRLPGATKEEVIRRSTKLLSKPMNLEADFLAELLLERERLAPTALNNGIAVPHTRDFLLSSHHDVVTFAFPEKPIHYGSLDGLPVHTLIFLFASDNKRHLHLLAKIAHLSNQHAAVDFLKTAPNKDQLLEFIKNWESSIPLPAVD